MPKVHSTAIVDPAARIAEGVSIGPYCIVGPNVDLGTGVQLVAHVVVDGHTSVGAGTVIHPFASIGLPPQHLKYHGEPSRLIIGANTVIREHVTMHTGTAQGAMETRVGSHCFLMVGSHVAHDCVIEDHVILTNGVALGGHVHIGEYAILGGLSGVHQFVRIGKHAMVGGKTGVDSDIIPYGSVKGNRAKLVGLNIIGLKRRGFSRDDMRTLRAAYGLLFSQGGTLAERLNEVVDLYGTNAGVMDIVNFIRADSSRALCTPHAAANGNGG
ncbi:MAG: acyl-ACP--UDP-N-acetylglucosamine O-acyltransferase [Rhodospirillaceae bacterium]|nr:MAG: acyl-ACP--UDP-N-acetylglucosamine O-acyltransferase [Rhodospirillaceae bacterium]